MHWSAVPRIPEFGSEKTLGRRTWLQQIGLSGLAVLACRNTRGQDPGKNSDLDATVELVQARARKGGLAALSVKAGERYVAIGNASPQFQATALDLCEGLATDFLTHFTERKFPVQNLSRKLPIVILANPDDFAAFLGLKDESDAVAGIYEVRSGWLVVRDNRRKESPQGARANTVSLFHEATHQLAYETRILDRDANLPLAIVEGLGTYGEVRRPDGRTRIGALNAERLQVLGAAARDGLSLFGLNEFFTDDELFEFPRTEQLAYAQAWGLIHMLMQPARVTKFQAYLERANSRREPRQRIDDLQAGLGSLEELESELKKHLNRLIRKA